MLAQLEKFEWVCRSGLCYVSIDFLTRRIYGSYIGEGALSSPIGGYMGKERHSLEYLEVIDIM